jgi:hypothetical protein
MVTSCLWLIIRLLVMLGLAWDVVTPNPRLALSSRGILTTHGRSETLDE